MSLEHGSFGIKRTDKAFSRQPIDLTLEQIINADAANKLKGILHFTNSIGARQRCVGVKVPACDLQSLQIFYNKQVNKKKEDITADLEKTRFQKSTAQLNKLLKGLKQHLNPFDTTIDKQELFNIANGQAVPKTISQCLLNVEINRNELRQKFISECTEDHPRFEKPIKQNKIMTFVNVLKNKENFCTW